jgi:energy-coupling factor transporter ATP-binding protein EcfA2
MQRVKQGMMAIASWAAPGSGAGLTLHYLSQSQVKEALIAGVGTLGLTLLTGGRGFGKRVWTKLVEKLEERLEQRADRLAQWLLDRGEQGVIRLWWSVTANFRGQYYKALIYRYRDFRTQGLKTRGPFALDLETIFVPLRIAPESLFQIKPEMIQALGSGSAPGSARGSSGPSGSTAQPNDGLLIWDWLAALRSQPSLRQLVILGAPGSGKTTLLEHLALIYARGKQRQQHPKAPKLIPIVLYLREVQYAIAVERPPELEQLIEQQPYIAELKPAPGWFKEQLEAGRCLVMLDGLDEVGDLDRRRQVGRWVDGQMRRFGDSTFLMTSRPFGYRSTQLESLTILEVKPFSLVQMTQFIQNWYLQTETLRRLGQADPGVKQSAQVQAQDLVKRIENSPAIAAMALNPLLLTMIATVHCYRGALPGRRVELYGEICDVLLGRRQEAKGLGEDLSVEQKKAVLQTLAYKLTSRRVREFKRSEAVGLIRKRLLSVAGEQMTPEAFLIQSETETGLIVERRPGVYEFAHKSFQEYLTALQTKAIGREFILTQNIDDDWWEEVIRLYAAQNDASDLIWAALQKNTIAALALACDCLEEGLSVSAAMRQEVEERLDEGLESPDGEIFALAAAVKLSRRLKRLLRLDERRDIDLSPISWAEYQLFLDEGLAPDSPYRLAASTGRPDRWSTDRFPAGEGLAPVLGIRHQDAIAFCDWLTQRVSSLGDFYLEGNATVFMGDHRFRLPTPAEQGAYPIGDMALWCRDGTGSVQLSNDWSIAETQALSQRLTLHLNQDADRISDPILVHVLRFTNVQMLKQLPGLIDRGPELTWDTGFWQQAQTELDRLRGFNLGNSDISRYRDIAAHLLTHLDGPQLNVQMVQWRDRTRPGCPDLGDRLLLLVSFWQSLSDFYAALAKRSRLAQANQQPPRRCKQQIVLFDGLRDRVFETYIFGAMVRDSLQKPLGWGGLRIVRDRR